MIEPVIIGDATLYCGDCLDVLPTLGKVDLSLVDYPYGLDYPYLSYDDTQENLKHLILETFDKARDISKRLAIFTGVNNIWLYPKSDWILIWSWDSTTKYGYAGYNQWQPLLLYGKDIEGFGSVNTILKSDKISFTGGNGIGFLADLKDKSHPCPKPLNVMEKFIARLSNENETVCDYMMGSGTTGVAALKLGRKFIGVEIDPTYFKIACDRIAKEANQMKLEFAGVK